LKYINL